MKRQNRFAIASLPASLLGSVVLLMSAPGLAADAPVLEASTNWPAVGAAVGGAVLVLISAFKSTKRTHQD